MQRRPVRHLMSASWQQKLPPSHTHTQRYTRVCSWRQCQKSCSRKLKLLTLSQASSWHTHTQTHTMKASAKHQAGIMQRAQTIGRGPFAGKQCPTKVFGQRTDCAKMHAMCVRCPSFTPPDTYTDSTRLASGQSSVIKNIKNKLFVVTLATLHLGAAFVAMLCLSFTSFLFLFFCFILAYIYTLISGNRVYCSCGNEFYTRKEY